VIKVDIGSLLTHIKNLKPECFAKTSEVSMRKKPRAQKRETKTIEDGKFQAAIQLLPAPEPEPELEPEPEPVPPTEAEENDGMTVEQFHPKKRPPKKSVPTPAAETEPEPTAEPEPEPEPAVEPEPEPVAPKKPEAEPKDAVASAELEGLEEGFIKVCCTEVCFALNLMSCNEDPPDADYEKLRKNTSKFFTKQLKKIFGAKFESLEVVLHHKEFGAEKPDKNYNIYIEWIVEAIFLDETNQKHAIAADRRTSLVNTAIPTGIELASALAEHTKVMDYMVQSVQPIDNSPFAMVTRGKVSSKSAMKTIKK